MSKYYLIRTQSVPRDVKGWMDIEDYKHAKKFRGWGVGKIAEKQPTEPVEISATPKNGYELDPADWQDQGVPFMSKRLKAAIDSAGVDNINYLPITLKNTETGKVYEYFAFNLLGLVDAADPAQSKIDSHDGDFVGDSQINDLIIDDEKCGGLLMFRLKQKFSAVVVHEKIKKAVEAAGITTVTFMKPEDYMAL
jgi:hypothetical protein